eukprot:764452-Hanusia_phi.AAC.1
MEVSEFQFAFLQLVSPMIAIGETVPVSWAVAGVRHELAPGRVAGGEPHDLGRVVAEERQEVARLRAHHDPSWEVLPDAGPRVRVDSEGAEEGGVRDPRGRVAGRVSDCEPRHLVLVAVSTAEFGAEARAQGGDCRPPGGRDVRRLVGLNDWAVVGEERAGGVDCAEVVVLGRPGQQRGVHLVSCPNALRRLADQGGVGHEGRLLALLARSPDLVPVARLGAKVGPHQRHVDRPRGR